jgi:isoquinoline 1-oxidoreductase subunit beta
MVRPQTPTARLGGRSELTLINQVSRSVHQHYSIAQHNGPLAAVKPARDDTFADYRALRMNETPAIEVHLVRNGEAPGGIGEPGTAATAPALANAVFAATGRRIRQLPLQKAVTKQ